MVKKSLLSSTSKKKTKAKKKDDRKKTTASKKNGAAKSVKKDAGAKAASKKKTTSKSTKATKPVKSAAKAKAPKKAAPKTATKQKKPVSIKELVLKKFDTIPPETLYSAPVDTTRSEITSPPFISESAPEEIERIRKLLFKQFDLNTPDTKEEAPAEKPVVESAPEPEAKEEAPVEKPAEEPAPEPEAKEEAPVEEPAEEPAPEPEAKEEAPVEEPAEAPAPEPEAKEEAPVKEPAEEPAPEPEAKEEAPVEEPAEEPAPEPEAKEEAPVDKPREKISVYEVPKEKALPFSEVTSASTSQPEEPPVNESDASDQGDNMQKPIAIAGACFAAVLILIIGVSFSNMGNFEIKDHNGIIEIWKGRFAPIGSQKMMVLEGMTVTEEMLGASSRKDAYTLIFKSYIEKADALLETPGMPDYEAIRSRLNEAKSYAVTAELKSLVTTRLHKIEMITLLYKADILVGKGTLPNLKTAKKYLDKAARLKLGPSDESLVNQRLQWIESQIEGMAAVKVTAATITAPAAKEAVKVDH
jgi:colicin import membrane protein